MNQLAKFFLQAKNDSGSLMELMNVSDGFSGVIYFTEENYIDCSINNDGVRIYDNTLTKDQELMFDAFANYVDGEMRDSESTRNDIIQTDLYLSKTAHW